MNAKGDATDDEFLLDVDRLARSKRADYCHNFQQQPLPEDLLQLAELEVHATRLGDFLLTLLNAKGPRALRLDVAGVRFSPWLRGRFDIPPIDLAKLTPHLTAREAQHIRQAASDAAEEEDLAYGTAINPLAAAFADLRAQQFNHSFFEAYSDLRHRIVQAITSLPQVPPSRLLSTSMAAENSATGLRGELSTSIEGNAVEGFWSHYRSPADWQKIMQDHGRASSETTWRRFRDDFGGTTDDQARNRLCRFPMKELSRAGIRVPEMSDPPKGPE